MVLEEIFLKIHFKKNTKKLYIFNVYNSMSWHICIKPWKRHHNLCYKHIHHLQKFPFPFFLLQTLNMIYLLKFLSIRSLITNYRHWGFSAVLWNLLLFCNWNFIFVITTPHIPLPPFFVPSFYLSYVPLIILAALYKRNFYLTFMTPLRYWPLFLLETLSVLGFSNNILPWFSYIWMLFK